MLRRLVLALALALAGSAVTAVSLSSPADALPPMVGTCHQLTFDQAWNQHSDPVPAVPCSGPHTTQTVAVVPSSSLAGLSDDQISEMGAQLCWPSLKKALGPELLRAQSLYSGWYFAPSAQEIAAGDAWFRCDVGLSSGAALVPLPHHLLGTPLVTKRIPDSVRKCLAGKTAVTCTHRHTLRSIGAFNLTASAIRSKAGFERLAHRKCPGATGYVFPTADDFKTGYRVVVCYKKTRH